MSIAHDQFDKAVKRKIEKIKQMNMPGANRKAILDFGEFCYTEGLGSNRVLKYLITLPKISDLLQVKFAEATRTDIERTVNQIERYPYSEWTKHDYRVSIKKFYKWLKKTDYDYPPEVKWIRSTTKKERTKLPEELLTQDEVQAIITAAKTVRDKAIIASLYESGCRISELLYLQMKQVQEHPHGFQINVTGKKGSRRLLLIVSSPYLTEWLNQHPRRDDPDEFLWVTEDYRAKRLGYERVCIILKNAAKRAGINKAVNPHNFRHSRATHLAKHLTEAQMNEYMGWVQGSNMPATYVHLSGRDIDNALLKLNNIPVAEEKDSEKDFSLKTCSRCDLKNPPSNKFCSRCGIVLDEEAANELMKRNLDHSRADTIMDKLLRDSEFRAILQQKLEKLNTIEREE